MRLYHFTTQKYGLLALEKRRLKIARLNELNDPFEFMGWNMKESGLRAKLKKWKNQRNDEIGIVCFTQKWSNPLLWGHYAEKHQGIAIGFDVPDGNIYNPVRYHPTRLPVPSSRELQDGGVEALLLTKFSAWRYESEYRCFCLLADSIKEGDHYFEPFSETLAPAEVIVGDRSTISRSDLAQALGSEYAHVKSFQARPAFGSFSVVPNRNRRLWI